MSKTPILTITPLTSTQVLQAGGRGENGKAELTSTQLTAWCQADREGSKSEYFIAAVHLTHSKTAWFRVHKDRFLLLYKHLTTVCLATVTRLHRSH